VQDIYAQDYYAGSPAADPQGAEAGQTRVLRGGGWNTDMRDSRSGRRAHAGPGFRGSDVGFRVVVEAGNRE
jgi:formylglycine-generating enzyme required for sulfatase activity